MSLVLPHPSLGTGVVNPTDIEEDLTEIVSKINGNIDNSDIKAGAAIDVDKLSAQYEWMCLQTALPANSFDAGTTNLTANAMPLPNDGKGNWRLAKVSWNVTADAGAGNGTFAIRFGYFNAGAWTTISTPMALHAMGSAGDGLPFADSETLDAELAFDATKTCSLMPYIGAADGTSLDTGVMNITYMLKRKITGV